MCIKTVNCCNGRVRAQCAATQAYIFLSRVMINCDNDRYRTRMAYYDYGCLDYRKIEADFDEFLSQTIS